MDGPEDEESGAAGRVDRGQLLLVACCLVAVAVAAVVAPTPVEPEAPDTPQPTPRDTDSTAGADTGDPAPDDRVVGEGGKPAPIPDESAPPTDGCGVLLENEPVPGSTVTVGVFESADPVSGVQVGFNGESVGQTDERGRVTGEVPYNRTLAVSVDVAVDCTFYRERFDDDGDERGRVSPARQRSPGGERAGFGSGFAEGSYATPPGPDAELVTDTAVGTATAMGSANNTGEYLVRGDLDVRVVGDPYPESSVRVFAEVDGVPVRDGTVTLDESTVGETDGTGGLNLTVPGGSQSVWVSVGRGDFEGETDVDVLLLTASLHSREGFAVPGERAEVVAKVDERPANGVTVRRAGRRLGTTGTEGNQEFRLPLSPGGTVVASTSRQTTTVPLWHLYVPTALNLFVLVSVGVVATGWGRLFRGRTIAARVATVWAAVAVADVALILGEWRGFGLSLVTLAVVGLVHQRRRARAGGEQAVGTAASLVAVARRTALWVADVLAGVLDRIWRFLGRMVTRLNSFELLAEWLGGLVRKVATTLWLYLTLRRAGVALFALAEIAAATARWGHEGLIASVAGFAVLATLVALLGRDDVAVPAGDIGEETGDQRDHIEYTPGSDAADDEERILSVRELWRRFAQWVVPGSWRTRTPGEVARAATERGFPREPVEALTEAFRDVEYGHESSTSRRERAKAAFDSLARENEEEDG